jgi:hypothetical protein
VTKQKFLPHRVARKKLHPNDVCRSSFHATNRETSCIFIAQLGEKQRKVRNGLLWPGISAKPVSIRRWNSTIVKTRVWTTSNNSSSRMWRPWKFGVPVGPSQKIAKIRIGCFLLELLLDVVQTLVFTKVEFQGLTLTGFAEIPGQSRPFRSFCCFSPILATKMPLASLLVAWKELRHTSFGCNFLRATRCCKNFCLVTFSMW